MDGAVYVTFSVVGQVITLADAPSVSLFVDYSTTESQVGGSQSVTLDKIQTEVYRLMAQKANSPSSTTFDTDRVRDAINDTVELVCTGRVTSLLDQNRTYRSGRLDFMEVPASYRYVTPQRLSAPFAVGDAVLEMATEGFATSGHVIIGGDVFSYSGKTATELTGVTGGLVPHFATEVVTQIFAFPTEADKPKEFSSYYAGQSVELPYKGTGAHFAGYSIIQSNGSKYLAFSNLVQDALVSGTFHKKLFRMAEPTDLCPIPGSYGITVIAPLVAGTFQFNHGMPNGQQNLVTAYAHLQNMFQYFTNDTVVQKQSIKPQAYGFASVAAASR